MTQDLRSEELSLFTLLNVLLRQRRLVVGVPLALGVAAAGLSLLRSPQYVAQARLMPQAAERRASGIAGVAAQLGFNLQAGPGSESPDFYVELVKSQELLRELADTRYHFAVGPNPSDSLEGTVIELFRIDRGTDEDRQRAAVDLLEQWVSASVGFRTGIVTVRTTAPWRELAVQLNRRLLELLNAHNLERRQSQAATERRFVEERMREVHAELTAAEGDLQRFLRRNRAYKDSPELAFEAARLERRVALYQQVYTALAQAHEQARIDEVRNTPAITIVDRPEGSARRVGGSIVVQVMLSLFFGAVLAIMLVFAREYIARQLREDPTGYAEFASLWGAATSDLRRLVRRRPSVPRAQPVQPRPIDESS